MNMQEREDKHNKIFTPTYQVHKLLENIFSFVIWIFFLG